jgi:flagella basal body P-ring formation protein FlgA
MTSFQHRDTRPESPREALATVAQLAMGCLLALAGSGAFAQSIDVVQHFVEREATAAASAGSGVPVRVEVTVGQPEYRAQRAPCGRIEPFLSPGVRLWGHTHVGIRCVEGADWSTQWPVEVRVYGVALVATRPLAAMQPITATDLRSAEVEWTRTPQGVATAPLQLDSRVPLRPIAPGQPIPLDILRAQMAVGQGDTVKLVANGDGFSIVTDGVAMNAAVEGQPVRVRTEAGRVLTGTAHGGRVVEVVF